MTDIRGRWPGILDSEGADSAGVWPPWSRDSRVPHKTHLPQNVGNVALRFRRQSVVP